MLKEIVITIMGWTDKAIEAMADMIDWALDSDHVATAVLATGILIGFLLLTAAWQ